MTALSVNLNKLALLRNSRGRNYPDLLQYAARFIELGVHGITIHPRPDERHIHRQDAIDLANFLSDQPTIELNIEGYPSEDFLALIEQTRPDQCTLVPDGEDQLTSDHGWDFSQQGDFLTDILTRLKNMGVRAAVFVDPDPSQMGLVKAAGADRIELYTEGYATAFHGPDKQRVFEQYKATAEQAQALGIGVNAGHDLDLENLACFLTIPGILEVSIGHALTIECIDQGMESVIAQYLTICTD